MIESAKKFAMKAHKNHFRKISKTPYIEHPIRVANLLKTIDSSEELICAAYLHDVVEDTSYTLKDIRDRFGDKVAEIVALHTEDKSKSWKERKLATIESLKNAPKEVKYLIIADRLDNLLDLEKDLETYGEKVWDQFNAGYDDQKWYNDSLLRHMKDGLKQTEIPPFYQSFEQVVQRIFSKEEQ